MESITVLNPLNISIVVKSPGFIDTDALIVGAFKYEIDEPEFLGEMKDLNDGLKDSIMKYRIDGTFKGALGKPFLFETPGNTIPAKNVILIGLGKRSAFNLDKMKTVGCMALRIAINQSFRDVAFAFQIIVESIASFSLSELSEAFTVGAMNEYMDQELKYGKPIKIKSFKILINPKSEAEVIKGIEMGLAKFQQK